MYADDVAIIVQHKSLDSAENDLKAIMEHYFSKWKLKVNANNKCSCHAPKKLACKCYANLQFGT